MMTSAILSQNQVPAMLGFVNTEVNEFICQEGKNSFECFVVRDEHLQSDECSEFISAFHNVINENYTRPLFSLFWKKEKKSINGSHTAEVTIDNTED